MGKTSKTLLALCVGAPLLAQAPSLTFYGVLDAGVAHLSHTLDFDSYHPVSVNPFPSKGPDSATGMFNGGLSQTRIGVKGSTDLLDDWKAIFTLESAINLSSGNVSNAAIGNAQSKTASNTIANNQGIFMSADSAISGQLFNRGAFIGLSNLTYGTLTIGHQQSLMLDAIPGYDALGGAQLFTPIGFSGTYGGGGATDNSRVDDAIKYRLKAGDFSLALLHKVSGVSGSSSAKGSDQICVAYESGNFGILAAYQAYKDAFSMGTPNGTTQPLGTLALTAFDTKSTWLGARYKAGPVLITAGYQKMAFTNPSDPVEDAGTTSYYGQVVSAVNVTPYTLNGAGQEKDQSIWWLGAAWDVTQAFTVAASYYDLKQDDWSQGSTLAADAGKKSGTQKYTSILLDYKVTRAFDAYLACMSSKYADALAVGYVDPSNVVTGLGMRYKF
jgi:general bacterial porin, GBP family